MPDGSGQTIQIALQALRLTRKIRLATLHRPQRTALPSPPPGKSKLRYSLYNTVVLRQYFPKKTDLSGYSQADLNKVALRLNQRPRKTLGFETPASKLQTSVAPTS